ncbi:histone-like nucleoid-structuring protein Lsr2 [Streptomyces sp. NPDC050392]|uniref:Lsr2 family DNA-binding protein n=1 Tax=Streptomyces sp. NPDC050392 TaxID=3155782 RepID=UPI003439F782
MTQPPAPAAHETPYAAARTTARHARDKTDLTDLLAALALPTDEDTITSLLPLLPPHPEEIPNVNAYTAVVLSMNSDKYSDQQIADHLGIERAEVTQIIDTAKTPTPASTPAPVPQSPAAPAPSTPVAQDSEAHTETEELLTWAAAHEDKAIRAYGEQAATALDAVRERRQADAELAQITSEAAQLEQRLADLRARESQLRPAAKTKTRDYDPREVRTWAREQNLTVPDRGQIPKTVLAAWRQRQTHQQLAVAS